MFEDLLMRRRIIRLFCCVLTILTAEISMGVNPPPVRGGQIDFSGKVQLPGDSQHGSGIQIQFSAYVVRDIVVGLKDLKLVVTEEGDERSASQYRQLDVMEIRLNFDSPYDLRIRLTENFNISINGLRLREKPDQAVQLLDPSNPLGSQVRKPWWRFLSSRSGSQSIFFSPTQYRTKFVYTSSIPPHPYTTDLLELLKGGRYQDGGIIKIELVDRDKVWTESVNAPKTSWWASPPNADPRDWNWIKTTVGDLRRAAQEKFVREHPPKAKRCSSL